jgi:hypothetical protein
LNNLVSTFHTTCAAMLPPLPVEMWSEILSLLMSIPAFLDPDRLPLLSDPFSSLHYYHEAPYWTNERLRNTLRRVCKTWDAILHRFQHRYVRLADMYHGHVPNHAIYKAIRIYCVDCGRLDCPKCFPRAKKQRNLFRLESSSRKLAVKILGGFLHDDTEMVLEAMDRYDAAMPHLEVVLNALVVDEKSKNWLSAGRTFQKKKTIVIDSDASLTSLSFHSTSLTTIIYCNEKQPFSFPLTRCDLPALRHLRFPAKGKLLGTRVREVIPILESLGQNLMSLQIGGRSFWPRALPTEIWTLCPKLQRLDSCLLIQHPPPKDHTLSTISIAYPLIFRQQQHADTPLLVTPIIPSLLNWPSLRRVILLSGWDELDGEDLQICRWVRECQATCDQQSVVFQDMEEGIPFKESRFRFTSPYMDLEET